MLKNLDLNKLRGFERVYARRNLVEAAADLGVTSSAVSQSVAGLEKEIGAQLFLRSGKKYLPTLEAEELRSAVLPLFEGLEVSLSRIRRHRHELEGTMRIGSVPEFGSRVLLPRWREFRESNSRVEASLVFAGTSPLLEKLLANELDFAFIDGSNVVARLEPKLQFREVEQEILDLVCSDAYFRRHVPKGKLGIKEFAALDHVPYHRGYEGVAKWYRFHFGRVPKFRASLFLDHVRGVLKAVQLGLGVGVLPRPLVQDEVAKGRLKVLAPGKRIFSNKILLARPGSRVPNALEKSFVDFVHRAPGPSR